MFQFIKKLLTYEYRPLGMLTFCLINVTLIWTLNQNKLSDTELMIVISASIVFYMFYKTLTSSKPNNKNNKKDGDK